MDSILFDKNKKLKNDGFKNQMGTQLPYGELAQYIHIYIYNEVKPS